MVRALYLAVILVLSACANNAPPVAQGDPFPMNPDKWNFGTNDITTVPIR
jgi:hypothetical protein